MYIQVIIKIIFKKREAMTKHMFSSKSNETKTRILKAERLDANRNQEETTNQQFIH